MVLNKGFSLPTSSRFSCKHFCLLISNIAAERVHSRRAFLHCKLRSVLSAKRIEKLFYMKPNLNRKRYRL
ncbi:hypothetical protein GQ600_20072 [Phytophthora cactorum]|nr:hypothetical protein GQ600_20072 [Phytophthora cactorum]